MKNSTKRVELLKAVSVSVNEFYFSPSKVRKGKARKAIKELSEFVEAIELPKATKSKTSNKQSQGTDEMMELFKQFLAMQGMTKEQPKVAKPKAKPKRRRKTTTKKATPQQRVADKQEKAFHGASDTPVTPSKAGKRRASIKEAQKAVASVSKANGSEERIAKRAKAQKEQLLKEFQTKLDLEFPLDGTSNEISFSELSLRQLAEMM